MAHAKQPSYNCSLVGVTYGHICYWPYCTLAETLKSIICIHPVLHVFSPIWFIGEMIILITDNQVVLDHCKNRCGIPLFYV